MTELAAFAKSVRAEIAQQAASSDNPFRLIRVTESVCWRHGRTLSELQTFLCERLGFPVNDNTVFVAPFNTKWLFLGSGASVTAVIEDYRFFIESGGQPWLASLSSTLTAGVPSREQQQTVMRAAVHGSMMASIPVTLSCTGPHLNGWYTHVMTTGPTLEHGSLPFSMIFNKFVSKYGTPVDWVPFDLKGVVVMVPGLATEDLAKWQDYHNTESAGHATVRCKESNGCDNTIRSLMNLSGPRNSLNKYATDLVKMQLRAGQVFEDELVAMKLYILQNLKDEIVNSDE